MTIDKERLAELCKGRQEWRVANPVDGSYCMSSDNREALNPEREVRDWLSDHKLKFPDSLFANYEVRCVTVTSEVEGGCIALLAENAALAAEVERLRKDAGHAEPMTRFCPGCGSVGEVPKKYRDCCPDGGDSRVIPTNLANKCHDLFQGALQAAMADKGGVSES